MTKQEQIEGMRREIENGFRKADCRAPYTNAPYPYFETQKIAIAEALYDAGYGDVSEYKAEIERLKDDYVKLQEQFAQYQMASDKEIKAQIKQAQIDILNKANERLNVVSREFGDDCDLCGVSAVCSCRCEINNLIKEVQNAEDKG